MSSDQSDQVAVVYLIWLPFGIGHFMSFIDSYLNYDSGYAHQLILLFNGVQKEADTVSYHAYAAAKGIKYISFYKKGGQDLEAYFWVANQLSHEYLLFLNSYAVLLAEGWLSKYMQAMKGDGFVGAVGATGSYESYYSSIRALYPFRWNTGKTLTENYKHNKMALKSLWYQLYFPPFPNPHLRTNAFIISRHLMLSLTFNNPKKKIKAHRFESGRNGFTQQLRKRKLAVLVMDRHGKTYEVPEWVNSGTFWRYDQHNLLVADNQTRNFEASGREEKMQLTFNAWGVNE